MAALILEGGIPGAAGGGKGGPLDGPALGDMIYSSLLGVVNGDFETWNLGRPGEDGFTGCPPLGVIFREGFFGSGTSAIEIKFWVYSCELNQTAHP